MIVLWHLEEAMMQLKHLVENIDRLETPKFDAPWGKFDLIYYHLNTAWNTRHFRMRQLIELAIMMNFMDIILTER